jgi:hypothetical protein
VARWRQSIPISAISLLGIFFAGNLLYVSWQEWSPRLIADPLSGLPKVFFWVWERAENLEFLDGHNAGVAVLAESLTLQGSRVQLHPRMQPVRLPPGVETIAVVRIDSDSHPMPAASDPLRDEVLRQVLSVCRPPAAGVQIDFDATTSQRTFYRTLLEKLREKLPRGMKLSITALASWCAYDDWIRDLPVDEAVPMLFRLGKGQKEVAGYLSSGADFRPRISRFSIGLSLDEPLAAPRRGRRIYFFNPQPWTRESVDEAFRRARELQ